MHKQFTVGQEVVCIADECKPVTPDVAHVPDVYYGKIYHIEEYVSFQYGVWFVSVSELPLGCVYSENSFAPVISISELMECLEMEEA